jgi:hypothetical protein
MHARETRIAHNSMYFLQLVDYGHCTEEPSAGNLGVKFSSSQENIITTTFQLCLDKQRITECQMPNAHVISSS